jgi:hypothetical protein
MLEFLSFIIMDLQNGNGNAHKKEKRNRKVPGLNFAITVVLRETDLKCFAVCGFCHTHVEMKFLILLKATVCSV